MASSRAHTTWPPARASSGDRLTQRRVQRFSPPPRPISPSAPLLPDLGSHPGGLYPARFLSPSLAALITFAAAGLAVLAQVRLGQPPPNGGDGGSTASPACSQQRARWSPLGRPTDRSTASHAAPGSRAMARSPAGCCCWSPGRPRGVDSLPPVARLSERDGARLGRRTGAAPGRWLAVGAARPWSVPRPALDPPAGLVLQPHFADSPPTYPLSPLRASRLA